MIKSDLHIHSTFSDGSLTITEIADRAVERELDVIAITDHDTLSHTKNIPTVTNLKIIPGIELSAWDYEKNIRVHILGYNIKQPKIVEKIARPVLEARNLNSLKQIQILNQNGYEIDIDNVKRTEEGYIYKQHIMDYLVSVGKVPEIFGEFYYKTFKNNGICAFDIIYLNPFDAVKAIKEAGGQAVLAHSGQQQNFYMIPSLVKIGLDGLEINHHGNSEKDKEIIRKYAEKYELFLTGGSDFHGIYEPDSPNIGDYISEQNGVDAIC